jgi:hypothetical protein
MIDIVTDIHERINWRKTKLTMMVMIVVVIDQKMIRYALMTPVVVVVVVLQVNVMIRILDLDVYRKMMIIATTVHVHLIKT